MSFEPDILVTSRDGVETALVVEVKVRVEDLFAAEQQIKRYMVRMRCPVGMLVSAEKMFLYRDTYTGSDETSVVRVGDFSMAGVLSDQVTSAIHAIAEPRQRGFQMEDAVQRWLEGLVSAPATAELPSDLREAIEDHVVPALRQGEVRAAGPRWQRTGS